MAVNKVGTVNSGGNNSENIFDWIRRLEDERAAREPEYAAQLAEERRQAQLGIRSVSQILSDDFGNGAPISAKDPRRVRNGKIVEE
ncbi:MAG: hypothetical protein A3B68_01980 [Candidatus Melainabacteria bacterium RIFCSPHIGHO2_02_FULL_34_12]|nr:MAG: hypothetical protein A3B68_01980 [Candidatus Melainabacteria bacterium RIFCSPHIGHO2_02_FULL_34_12]